MEEHLKPSKCIVSFQCTEYNKSFRVILKICRSLWLWVYESLQNFIGFPSNMLSDTPLFDPFPLTPWFSSILIPFSARELYAAYPGVISWYRGIPISDWHPCPTLSPWSPRPICRIGRTTFYLTMSDSLHSLPPPLINISIPIYHRR